MLEEVVEIQTVPSGSSASDTAYPISDTLLSYLSLMGKSSLLSVANIGASTLSRIATALEVIDTLASLEAYLIDASSLNGLVDGGASSVFAVPSIGESRLVRIIIILGEISPIGGAKVRIANEGAAYEIPLSTVTSEKKVQFNEIPASFANGFSIRNLTGVTLASWGNSIIVIPL